MTALLIVIHIIAGIILKAILAVTGLSVLLFIIGICIIGGTLNKMDGQQRFFED